MGRDKCSGIRHSLYNGSASNLPINAQLTHTHTHTQTPADYDITLTLTYLHLATPPTWRPQGCPQLLFTPGWFQLLLLRMLLHPEAPHPLTHTHSAQPASSAARPPPLSTSSPQSPGLLPPPPPKPPDPSLSSSATSAWHQRRYLHDLKKCFYTSKWRKFHVQRQRMSSPQIC